MKNDWICPNCSEPLAQAGGSLVCANQHAFDVAKEGYVNFLAGRQKAGSKGDTPEMLAARRRFLEAGYYGPLRARLVEMVAGVEHKVVAEIGCGEGYYIGGISEQISSSKCLGSDIAKQGMKMASKAYPKALFAVADTNKFVPLASSSVDVLLDIFAPRNTLEFRRVLRLGGRLIVVVPTERHLVEVRAVQPLLAVQPEKRRAVEESLRGEFELKSAETLELPLKLDGTAVADLVEMTPSARLLDEAAKTRLAGAAELDVVAEFQILSFG